MIRNRQHRKHTIGHVNLLYNRTETRVVGVAYVAWQRTELLSQNQYSSKGKGFFKLICSQLPNQNRNGLHSVKGQISISFYPLGKRRKLIFITCSALPKGDLSNGRCANVCPHVGLHKRLMMKYQFMQFILGKKSEVICAQLYQYVQDVTLQLQVRRISKF